MFFRAVAARNSDMVHIIRTRGIRCSFLLIFMQHTTSCSENDISFIHSYVVSSCALYFVPPLCIRLKLLTKTAENKTKVSAKILHALCRAGHCITTPCPLLLDSFEGSKKAKGLKEVQALNGNLVAPFALLRVR